MKLTIKTIDLQEMVSKSVKGASLNKMIPLTSLMEVKLEENVLTLRTTDSSNQLIVSKDKIEGKDFYAVVPVELFSKLVGKTDSEKISLTIEESVLKFKGNGNYDIPLPLDEEGALIEIPELVFDAHRAKAETVKLSTIKRIIATNKASLAETMEVPCMTGYYISPEAVITTDAFKVCYNENSLWTKFGNQLISYELMELLSLFSEEDITLEVDDDMVLASTKSVKVFGYFEEDADEFPAEPVKEYVSTEFPSTCTLPKQAVLKVLDRLSLFANSYSVNGVHITFTTDGAQFSTKANTELVKYGASKAFSPFACYAGIELLTTLINAIEGDSIDLWYGNETALKITSGKITEIMSLMEDEEE